MPEDRPARKGLLDEMEELERKRREKKAAKKKEAADSRDLDLSRIG